MGKKIKLPFLSKTTTNTSPWPWPSCHQPRILSFRNNNNYNKTIINSSAAYIDAETTLESSLFTNTSSSESSLFINTSSSESSTASQSGDPIENVIRDLRSTERLFFEPDETSSILEEANKSTTTGTPFKESLVLSMESQDPYIDFKKSMEEMVEAHGLKDWEDLEELLSWFLNMNGKSNHGYIVDAFIDQIVALAFASSSSSSSINGDFIACSSSSSSSASCSPASPLSFYTSSFSSDDSSSTPCCLSSLLEAEAEDDHEVQKQQKDDDASSS